MTQVTVTDFETREVEKIRYKCEHCGEIVTEDEINTIGYMEGAGMPDTETRTLTDEKQLCEGCVSLRRALEIRQKRKYLREWWTTRRKMVGIALYAVPLILFGASLPFIYADVTGITATKILGSFVYGIFFSVMGGILAAAIAIAHDQRHNE
jgi:hypothetical protein